MSVTHTTRQASVDEIAREMDRRGAVIEAVEAERNLYKGKYRALLKLISRTRDKLVHVTDHIEDEGDRAYFGSTNDADDLKSIYHEMMSWIWDATDETNRMKSDPYADIRKQRARAEAAETALTASQEEVKRLTTALINCRSNICGYSLTGSPEQADVVVSKLYEEIRRIDAIARATLAGESK